MMLTKLTLLSPSGIHPTYQVRVQSVLDMQASSEFTNPDHNVLSQTERNFHFGGNWAKGVIVKLTKIESYCHYTLCVVLCCRPDSLKQPASLEEERDDACKCRKPYCTMRQNRLINGVEFHSRPQTVNIHPLKLNNGTEA